jgi:hypothetical protein
VEDGPGSEYGHGKAALGRLALSVVRDGFRHATTEIPLYFFVLVLLAACHRTIEPVVTAEDGPLVNLSDPSCPNLNGTYEMFGQPLPGMPPYFQKVTAKVTLDRLLGVDWPAEDVAKPYEVDVVQDQTIRLTSVLYDREASGFLPLLPGDSAVCSEGEMMIRQAREFRGSSFEQLWRFTRTARSLKLEQDGTLVVRTSIRATHRSNFLAEEAPVQTYGARFRRLN